MIFFKSTFLNVANKDVENGVESKKSVKPQ